MASNYITPPMMQPVTPRPGQMPGHAPHQRHYHGFCSSCRHPIAQCMCHRECRKIEKELLVVPGGAVGPKEEIGRIKDVGVEEESRVNVTKKVMALMDLISPAEINTNQSDEKAADTNITMSVIDKFRKSISIGRIPYGMQTTVIGGGCCVHLSMEYMPVLPAAIATNVALVGALVMDSQGTILGWGKLFTDEGHQVKECIISTNPGAYLTVIAANAIARARWCEIISC